MLRLTNFYFILLALIISSACGDTTPPSSQQKVVHKKHQTKVSINITETELSASYYGPEFLDGIDTAHRLSNLVATELGKHLKSEFTKGNYLKVDFKNTIIKTEGNPVFVYPSENYVNYQIKMPFIKVKNSCDAFTGVEHRGTWAKNDIQSEFPYWINNLKAQIAVGNPEYMFFQTPEGFMEYWVQFRHKNFQGNCK